MLDTLKSLVRPFTNLKVRPMQMELRRYGNYNLKPDWGDYDPEAVIDNAYHASYYFNTCVDAIIDAVCNVPLKAYQRDKANWEEAPNTRLQEFLDYPNPFLTPRMLMERVVGHVILNGNSLWLKNYGKDGVLEEVWPLDPLLVSIEPDAKKFIKKYVYGRGLEEKKFDPDFIVHFKRMNLRSLHWGEGQTKVAQRLIDMDRATLDWNKLMLDNRGVFPGIIGVKKPINEAQRNSIREQLRDKRMVGGQSAGEELIIGSDITYHRVGMTAEEMDWLETRKMTRQDISMLMRVPLPLVSIYDDATLANVSNARKIFHQDRIIPFLKQIEQVLNLNITPDFGDRRDLWIGFDYSGIEAVRGEMFEMAKVANILVRLGWQPRAVNRHLGMGYRDEDIIEGELVVAGGAGNNIGTAAGTREVSATSSEQPNVHYKFLLDRELKKVHIVLEKEKAIIFRSRGIIDKEALAFIWFEYFKSVSTVSSKETWLKEMVTAQVKGTVLTVEQKTRYVHKNIYEKTVNSLYEKWQGKRAEKIANLCIEKMLESSHER